MGFLLDESGMVAGLGRVFGAFTAKVGLEPNVTDAALWTNGCYAQEASFAKLSETAETRRPVEPCEPMRFRR